MSPDRDQDPETCMWFCPDCQIWVGSELDTCSERHDKPRYPVRNGYDVEKKHSRRVTLRERIEAKLRRVF